MTKKKLIYIDIVRWKQKYEKTVRGALFLLLVVAFSILIY